MPGPCVCLGGISSPFAGRRSAAQHHDAIEGFEIRPCFPVLEEPCGSQCRDFLSDGGGYELVDAGSVRFAHLCNGIFQ